MLQETAQVASEMVLEGVGNIRTLDDLPLPRLIPKTVNEHPAPVLLMEAIRKVVEFPKAKFDETVDIAVKLGIDTRRGDQMVRGAASLPHGTGKKVRVAVFAIRVMWDKKYFPFSTTEILLAIQCLKYSQLPFR